MDEYDDINESHYDSETLIALTRKDIRYIRKNICDIKMALKDTYVTKQEFGPVRRIVYGLVSLVLTSVAAGVMYLILGGMQVIK